MPNSSHLYKAMFPFSIKYSKVFPIVDQRIMPLQIMEGVRRFLIEKEGDLIFISEDELIFDGTTERHPSRHNIFLSVDQGRFRIHKEETKLFLTYEISWDKGLFIFGLVFCILGLMLGSVLPCIAIGLHWLITLARHKNMFEEIVSDINGLNSEKIVSAKELSDHSKLPHKSLLLVTGLALVVIFVSAVFVYLVF